MDIKLDKVVTYHVMLPPLKSHDPLSDDQHMVMWQIAKKTYGL